MGVNQKLSPRSESQSKKLPAALYINNTLSEFTYRTQCLFLFIACLFAIYDTFYILCEIGRWWWCSSWPCPVVTASVVKSPSISSPWAYLWVEAVPARHQIKPHHTCIHCFLFFFECHVFTFYLSLLPSLSLSQTIAEGLMLGSVTVWVFVSKDESPSDADSFTQ